MIVNTICPRSLVPFQIVSYFIKWVNTSKTLQYDKKKRHKQENQYKQNQNGMVWMVAISYQIQHFSLRNVNAKNSILGQIEYSYVVFQIIFYFLGFSRDYSGYKVSLIFFIELKETTIQITKLSKFYS